MNSDELEKYKEVQELAKETMEFLRSFIEEGVTEKEIGEATEKFLREKGIESFWYYDLAALVYVGKRTTISISGRDYKATETKVKSNDLVTVDLGPEIARRWADLARSFIVENGKVISSENSNSEEMVKGIEVQKELHRQFKNFINEETSFEEACEKMNEIINELGFENLDFKNNLGHTIVKDKDDRIYMEAGNKTKFKEVDLFTFEPHIKKKAGEYGFKHENIYYFDQGVLKIL